MKRKLFFITFVFFQIFFENFSQNGGDNLFNSADIHYINISFPQENYWQLLTKNYKDTKDKDTNIYINADIIIDTISLTNVGIRLKGNSSYDHKGMKKPVKISFNEYEPNQTFDKLKQLNLNNGYLDPSMMREKLMLDFLNEKSLPAPRCTYAAVHFNNEYIGLYKIVEEVNKKFLTTHFGNNGGNLFKGDPGGTLQWKGEAQWNYYKDYDLKTNEQENNWSDLLNFMDAINNSPMENFKQNTEAVFNTSPFIRAWAANNLFVNLDSYFFLPHNYYLYHNETSDKLEWITWDVSVSFGVFPSFSENRAEKIDILYLPIKRHKHPLTYKMLEISDYRKEYLNAVCEFLYHDFTEEKLFPEIDSIAKKIRPYIEKESKDNQMYSLEDFDKNISNGTFDKWWYDAPALKSFITARRNFAINRLCELKWSCTMGESIEKSNEEILNIYPNPASDIMNVDLKIIEPETKNIEYKIVNIYGETVLEESVKVNSGKYLKTISTGNLIPGIYILSALSGCESYNKKIVVIKQK